MKHVFYFYLLVILFYALPINAQEYITYTVSGDVSVKTRGTTLKVIPGSKLKEEAVLTIGVNSKITLLNEISKKMITIKTQGVGTIASFIDKVENKTNNISDDYIAFVKKKLLSDKSWKDVNYMQSAGTSYRGLNRVYSPLKKAENGLLLEPLRVASDRAIESFRNNDINGLSEAAQALESLGICRYNFQLESDYKPISFNGKFVIDPLCLFDLVASLDGTKPFLPQLQALPVPISSTTNNTDVKGNILSNYYHLDSGAKITIAIDCVGYCEIAVISTNGKIETLFNGRKTNHLYFKNVTTGKIDIENKSADSAIVMFFINAE